MTGVAVGANSSDPDVLRLADAGVGGLGVELIGVFARSTVAGLSILVVGLFSLTLGAYSLNNVESDGTITFA